AYTALDARDSLAGGSACWRKREDCKSAQAVCSTVEGGVLGRCENRYGNTRTHATAQTGYQQYVESYRPSGGIWGQQFSVCIFSCRRRYCLGPCCGMSGGGKGSSSPSGNF